jgi:uncharacterized protein YjeT (DUF2065 family)
MSDFFAALGLVFAIEGLFLLAFPNGARAAVAAMMAMPDYQLRIAGFVSVLFGILILWLVRG